MKNTSTAASLVLAAITLCAATRADADMVTDWNANLSLALKTGLVSTPPLQARPAAIVQAAVYDAVNGIARRYQPYFVSEKAPIGTRTDAAAAQAAYTALVALFPTQKATFDAELAASIANLPANSVAVRHGLAWGEHVANLILAWRSTDGSTNQPRPYLGGTAPGTWRSLPTATAADGTLPAAFQQIATETPFAIPTPSYFRLPCA